MKKFILISGFLLLASALGLRAYFALVPPPEATLETPLAKVFPQQLTGWQVKDMDMADSPEMIARVTKFLKFDDAIFRVYEKGDTFVGLYVAYWKPGTASYRWAGAHTPDTCWVQNGWFCTKRNHKVPFKHGNSSFQPAEFGIYQKKGSSQQVYFWHLVGGEAMTYKQHDSHNIWGALVDVREHGFDLRQEQFFIRLSSNKSLSVLKQDPEFSNILDGLLTIGL